MLHMIHMSLNPAFRASSDGQHMSFDRSFRISMPAEQGALRLISYLCHLCQRSYGNQLEENWDPNSCTCTNCLWISTGLSRKPSRRKHEFSFYLGLSSPFGVFLSVYSAVTKSKNCGGCLALAKMLAVSCDMVGDAQFTCLQTKLNKCVFLIVFAAVLCFCNCFSLLHQGRNNLGILITRTRSINSTSTYPQSGVCAQFHLLLLYVETCPKVLWLDIVS